jgi:hypothetical protein
MILHFGAVFKRNQQCETEESRNFANDWNRKLTWAFGSARERAMT